jgi:hypothetical protein
MDRVFPWLTLTLSTIATEGFPVEDKLTATKFLEFMLTLTEVVLQDDAVIFIKHPNCQPNRQYHPLFAMDVFQSNEFKSFVEVMCASLASSTSPFDASLETILPGMNAQFHTLHQGQEQLFQNQQLKLKNLQYTFRELYISGHHLQQNLFVGTFNAQQDMLMVAYFNDYLLVLV